MKEKRFASYSEEFQLMANTLPMLVSVTKNPTDETDDQFISTHDRFIALDDISKDKMVAPKTATIIQAIGKTYNLNLIQMSDIARAIRNFYFGELTIENLPSILAKEFPIELEKANEISKAIIEKIINDDSQEQAYQASLENIILPTALKQYPGLGEQLITSEKITLKSFPEPVRPSIKNWLADYTFTLGYNSHSSIERGNYIFQNQNTKNLSSQDRQKLSYILKAYDEGSQITIDKNSKTVVFEKTPSVREQFLQKNNRNNPTSEPIQKIERPVQKISFSSPQRMSYEKPRSQNYRQPTPLPKTETPSIKRPAGKNIINLRDDF